jgi:hypothetical protein
LQTAQQRQAALTARERIILDHYVEALSAQRRGLSEGNIHYEKNERSTIVGIDESTEVRVNIATPWDWHMNNVLRFYLRGDLSQRLSYSGIVGFTYDRVGLDSFSPYSFTKNWDGTHITFGDERYDADGSAPIPYFSYQLEPEIAARLVDDDLLLRAGRFRREWGVGDGSLSLSRTARPFEAFEVHARLAPWVSLSNAVGSLTNWEEESATKVDANALSYQRNLTIGALELFPNDWLYLSATASAIWGKRFELGYLNPLLYSVLYQNLAGDFDNMAQAVSVAVTIAPWTKIYFTFFADEMEFTSPEKFRKRPRNMVAYQAGVRAILPWLPFTLMTAQYTKIEPFTYAHYEEQYPFFSNPVAMSYTNDGENLGYQLAPNSDEFLIRLQSLPTSRLNVELALQLIRHGDNPSSPAGTPVIHGDVTKPFDYSQVDAYPDKDFLRDGLYDWNSIVTVSAGYRFEEIPAAISGHYSFAYTFWRANDSGETVPADELRNVLGFKVEVFR